VHLSSVAARAFTSFLAVLFALSPGWAKPSPARSPDGNIVIPAAGSRPELVFASDTATEKLQALFTPVVIQQLKDLHAGIAIAISDFSPERARVVRDLSDAQVPVTAWLVLPKEQGYYFNISNAPEAAVRFSEFQTWTAAQNLHWAAVGLDIEPKLDELQGGKLRIASTLLRRTFDYNRVERAHKAYGDLVRTMKTAGYKVQTYQLVFLADERKARSTMFERTLGLVDVRGDEEVLMIYSSFNHDLGAAWLWSYGPDAQAIAIGSTAPSGMPELDARYPPLNWDEFSRDLLAASHYSKMIGIYSLEGCVQQGFLARLQTLDWNQSVTVTAKQAGQITGFRKLIRFVLWAAANLFWICAFVLAAIAGFIYRRRVLRRQHAEQVPERNEKGSQAH
jgi:hypothetical protein